MGYAQDRNKTASHDCSKSQFDAKHRSSYGGFSREPKGSRVITPSIPESTDTKDPLNRNLLFNFKNIGDHAPTASHDDVEAFSLKCYERICDLRTGALGVYQDFLTLWKDADSDIPVLKQDKAEYAKLR